MFGKRAVRVFGKPALYFVKFQLQDVFPKFAHETWMLWYCVSDLQSKSSKYTTGDWPADGLYCLDTARKKYRFLPGFWPVERYIAFACNGCAGYSDRASACWLGECGRAQDLKLHGCRQQYAPPFQLVWKWKILMMLLYKVRISQVPRLVIRKFVHYLM